MTQPTDDDLTGDDVATDVADDGGSADPPTDLPSAATGADADDFQDADADPRRSDSAGS